MIDGPDGEEETTFLLFLCVLFVPEVKQPNESDLWNQTTQNETGRRLKVIMRPISWATVVKLCCLEHCIRSWNSADQRHPVRCRSRVIDTARVWQSREVVLSSKRRRHALCVNYRRHSPVTNRDGALPGGRSVSGSVTAPASLFTRGTRKIGGSRRWGMDPRQTWKSDHPRLAPVGVLFRFHYWAVETSSSLATEARVCRRQALRSRRYSAYIYFYLNIRQHLHTRPVPQCEIWMRVNEINSYKMGNTQNLQPSPCFCV